MKRVKVCLGIMAVMIGLCFWSLFHAHSHKESLLTTLLEGKEAFASGDFKKSSELSEKAIDEWNQYRTSFLFLGDFDWEKDLSNALAEMSAFSQIGDDQFYSKCFGAMEMMNALFDAQYPVLKNIL